jgi:hypothetical protein
MAQLKPAVARVGILTTQAVVLVQRIEVETQAVRSVMCINRTSVETGVSRAYSRFVDRQTGIVAKATGAAAYRADVDNDVTVGQSWQLAMFLAHLLHHDGRLAGVNDPRDAQEVWLATGEVDADHRVHAIDAIDRKIRALEAWLATEGPRYSRVIVFAPLANQAEAGAPLAVLQGNWPQLEVRFMDHVDTRFDEAVPSLGKRKPSPALVMTALAAAVLVGATTVLLVNRARPEPVPLVEQAPRSAGVEPVPTEEAPPPAQPAPVAEEAASSTPRPAAKVAAASLKVVVSGRLRSGGLCYGSDGKESEYAGSSGGKLELPAAAEFCTLSVRASRPDGKRVFAHLVGINGATPAASFLGDNGRLNPVLTDWGAPVATLDIAFAPGRSLPANSSSTPRIRLAFPATK